MSISRAQGLILFRTVSEIQTTFFPKEKPFVQNLLNNKICIIVSLQFLFETFSRVASI